MLQLTDAQVGMLDADGQKAYREMVKQSQALAQALSGAGKFSVKLGSKGTIVINGFGRYPVSLYREQYSRFKHWLTHEDGFKTIDTFIAANEGNLKTKAQVVVEG